MDTNNDNEPRETSGSSLTLIALIFAAQSEPDGWIDVDRLVPLAGGGLGGRRAVSQALGALEHDGLVERERVGGKAIYRRTSDGLCAAEEALQAEDPETDSLLGEVATAPSFGTWQPEAGAPASFNELVGQAAAKHVITQNIQWAHRTGRLPASMLLYGPSGYGKTLLAGLTARELGLPFLHVSVADLALPDLQIAVDLASEGGVLFLDELQAGTRRIRDALLVALDPSRQQPFLALGATTDPGKLTAPLRRRFQLEIPLEEYSVSEAELLTLRRSAALGILLGARVPYLIARAARANPARIARLVTEAAMLVEGTSKTLSSKMLAEYLRLTNRDERGVDSVELEMLAFLRDECEGPAGMSKFVDSLGLDVKLVRERLQMLRREGLIRNRGRAGHELTKPGYDYLERRVSQ